MSIRTALTGVILLAVAITAVLVAVFGVAQIRSDVGRNAQERVNRCLNTFDALFTMLADRTPVADPLLPDTGIGLARERLLAPLFIAGPGYRCTLQASAGAAVHFESARPGLHPKRASAESRPPLLSRHALRRPPPRGRL